jgi:MFS transporter, DHA1 family, inner membrane transport protein
MPKLLLIAAALGMFTAGASGTTRAPFLIDMARDLSSSVPIIANLLAVNSIAWGGAAFLAGPGSDRWGCRPFLVGGPIGLACASIGIATAPSLFLVAVWTTFGGFCCGMFTGPIFTEVSHRVAASQQGRALGWAMSGQSLTLLVGAPMAAWMGAYIGWRGVFVCVGALGLVSALGFLATARHRVGATAATQHRAPSLRAALSGPVLRLLAMGVTERICYGLVVVYFATFLQMTFALHVDAIVWPLGIFAIGTILGTLVGGQIADRVRNRRLTFALSMLSSAIVALGLFGWTPNLPTTVALGFIYMFCNAIARPSLMASLADVDAHVRGTVMGLSVTSNSMGWLGAAALGGWMMTAFGFGAFGPLTLITAVISVTLALTGRR